MKDICKKHELCTGCTACVSVCPKHCIKMLADDEGFKYPYIDKDMCINCGICKRVCPVNYKGHKNVGKKNAYVARAKDDKLLKICSSGGVFTAMAKNVLLRGGIIYGAIYDEDLQVVHSRIDNIQDIEKLAGSKYVQSSLEGIFERVKNDIEQGNFVLFCGTPCQCEGLNKYLGKDTENIVMIDLVCHGVPSPLLWNAYCSYLNKNKGEIISANFRSKHYGYHTASMEIKFADGSIEYGSARTNMMLKSYFRNVADRMSCYSCEFKTMDRCSDLTVFDSWHASKLCTAIKDDDKGYTNVIVQSNKGNEFLKTCINDLKIYEIDVEKAIQLDGNMAIKSVPFLKEREDFYYVLKQHGIEGTIEHFFPITKKDYIIEKSKELLKVLGLSFIIKKLKGR